MKGGSHHCQSAAAAAAAAAEAMLQDVPLPTRRRQQRKPHINEHALNTTLRIRRSSLPPLPFAT